jgi:hypothetical protein
MLRAEPALFGLVASDPVVSRLVTRLAGDAPQALKAIRAARAAARQWGCAMAGDAAPGAAGGQVTVDIDATIVTSHFDKEQARPTGRSPRASIPRRSSLITARMGRASRWPSRSARETPARKPPSITSTPSGSRWRNFPQPPGGGC